MEVSIDYIRSYLSNAALMKAVKMGWGCSGVLLNSGWNWVPMKNGWPGILYASVPGEALPGMQLLLFS